MVLVFIRHNPDGVINLFLIGKPIGFYRESTALNDTDMKYLLLYLEETYGLTNEKKIDNAIGIVANENKYHPIRDYLNTLVWDGTERIRFCLPDRA